MRIGTRTLEEVDGITSKMCIITPEDAEYFLSTYNTRNRKLKAQHVDNLVTEIENGAWEAISDAIGFSRTNVLLNGQHRLEAIKKSGKQVELLIVTGLADSAQKKTDRGGTRTPAEVFGIAGICNNKNAVQVARFLVRKRRYFRSCPDVEIEQMILSHTKALSEVIISGWPHRPRIGTVGVAAAIVVAYETYPDRALEFKRRLFSGVSNNENDPILKLRKSLEKVSKDVTQSPIIAYEKTIYAINMFILGKDVFNIKRATEIVVSQPSMLSSDELWRLRRIQTEEKLKKAI